MDHRGLCRRLRNSAGNRLRSEASMKIKMLAVIFLSTIICLAQSNNPNAPAASQTQTNQATSVPDAACPCCKAMADAKDTKPCCQSAKTDDKDTASCCHGKQAMSCMKDEKTKSADAGRASCCGASDQKGCCAKSEKPSDKTAMACCGGPGGHCGMQQHEHADPNK